MSQHYKLSSHRLGLAIMLGIAVLLLGSQGAVAETWSAPGGFGPLRWLRPGQEAAPSGETARGPVLSPSASAAELWTSYPLHGGEMTAIAAHPTNAQIVYVGTRDAGAFKTTDGGQSWRPARNGLTFYPIRCLEIDPRRPDTLYAGTDYDGIWKSSDGGATWTDASAGLDKSLVALNIAIDPLNTNTLYAGLGGGIGLILGNIFKSVDGGATWTMQDSGLPRYPETMHTGGVYSLAIDPAHPAVLYAGTIHDGAFRSTDGGAHWVALNTGLPFRSGSAEYREGVNALATDPHHANRLSAIIGGEYYVYEQGLWQRVNQGYDHANSSIGPGYLYFHPSDPAILYSGGGGFHKSTDGGVHWQNSYGTVVGTMVPDIAFHPSTPDTLYAATSPQTGYAGGVAKSSDQGENWVGASAGITALLIHAVAVDPQSSQNIYAGTDGSGHFYRTQDGGATWQFACADTTWCAGIDDIAVDPTDSRKIYVVAWPNLFQSTDQGATFARVTAVNAAYQIAVVPQASSPIYVAARQQGIYKSADSGQTWVQKNQGLPNLPSCGGLCPAVAVAVDPSQPGTVWAGLQFGGGIAKTTDGGEHWQVMGVFGRLGDRTVECVAVHPRDGSTILTGVLREGLFKSTDGGKTWQPKLEDVAAIRKIVYDPRNPNWVYAATEGFGVLRSLDGGETWQGYSSGIFYPVVYSLAITTDSPAKLLAGSYSSGLYWARLPSLAVVHLPALLK
ncbi:MAG: hypothetical protein GXY76_18115 [Chloroflexi bacterium]|nr:hypothetical protein [Chloroflexota bacterium]